jgi:flagellar hook-associated protein 3 FlgL
MKVSFVSSQAISKAMRYQAGRLQAELTKATTEMATLRVADTGLALGARSSISVSLNREIDRLKGITDSNELASARLKSTQLGLQELTDAASKLLEDYSTALSGAGDPGIAREQAARTLIQMSSVLNTNLSGENIFAGINTDVTPFNDFLDTGSPNRVAFDAAFSAHFHFAADDPAAANIDAADMEAFLASVESQFTGSGWHGAWSLADDQAITTRITLTETAQTSVTANIIGVRKLAMAAATVAAGFAGPLNEDARNALLENGIRLLGEAVADLANQQGHTGVVQQRVTQASERMSTQIDLFTDSIRNLEGVDEFEAAAKVTTLKTQLEISYSLTASMQKLSLINYLS